jgi:hypothetical protein
MVQNPFDAMSDRVFDACERTMGYDASWLPSGGGSLQTARVLFKEPTYQQEIGEYADSYIQRTFFMEYWDGDFIGLDTSVRDDGNETVTITFNSGDREFYVRSVERKYDGRNFKARIEEIL